MGDGSWIPYVIIACFIILVLSCIYVYKHKEEMMEITGIELPGMTEKRKKQNKNVRLNAKRTGKMYGSKNQRKIDSPADNSANKIINRKTEAQNPSSNSSQQQNKNKSKKEGDASGDDEETRISDVPIITNTPLTACALTNTGSLLMCAGKNHQFFLFTIGNLDYQLFPFQQTFELDSNDILAVCSLQKDNTFQIIYTKSSTLSLASSYFTVDDEAKPLISEGTFKVPSAYISSIQKIISSPGGKFVLSLVDKSILNVYDSNGTLLTKETFGQAKCLDFAVLRDFSRIAISCGNKINIYRINQTPFKLELESSVTVSQTVVSLSISEKTHQLVAACADGSITIYKEPADSGVALRFKCSSVRIVRAAPTSDFVAIISRKSRLMLVNITTGELVSQLDMTHEGDANFLEWSLNGNWIFIGSNQKPNISTFYFGHDDANSKK
ncbi:hypothetical protein M9Y10_042473 [Tritrichomonas musculus]|uniref:Anaphase-promoting complex subunit 4 WD40 domain-containing protein n=1 Tax=Tritrichomonas musculus TaxID=1915356 RepID=A0ABR2GPU5_9EUKA